MYPPRPIQGFYTKEELRSLVARGQPGSHWAAQDQRRDRPALIPDQGDPAASDRHREEAASRPAGHGTGQGKTRTAIALVDMLQPGRVGEAGPVLADRKELVTQATNAFKQHLPGTPVVNLRTERQENARVYVSTTRRSLNMINKVSDKGHRSFGPGHFDLIIVDEAHRSIFNKYKSDLRVLRRASHRADGHSEERDRPQHLPHLPTGR